jgi:hypothetical protein
MGVIMGTKRIETAESIARAAAKADQARDGARAMREYVERRAQALAKLARLRALRIAHEHGVDGQKNGATSGEDSNRSTVPDRIGASRS